MEKLRQGIQNSEGHDVQIVTYDDLLDHAAAKAGCLAKLTELSRKELE